MGWSVAQGFGLTQHRPQLTFKGYTLVTPTAGDATYLVDMDGRFVHRWRFEGIRPGLGELLPNGNLLARGIDASLQPAGPAPAPTDPPEPFEQRVRRLGGNGSILREVTWDGETVWEHRDIAMHHDFARLPNGNTLFPVWVEMPEQVTKAVKGGSRAPRQKLPPLGDDLVEVDAGGTELRRIETWRLLDPRADPICALEGRIEWTHMNSVDVNADGEILVSFRNNSTVAIISAAGELSWKYGVPNVAHQHDATWVNGRHIQIVDNGMHRLRGMSTSRVIEVDPATNEVFWTYQGDPPAQFFSGHISGAARLPNRNVLVCEGTSGRIFEVTPAGEVVWEWWNPVYNARPDGAKVGWVFRASRYSPDHPALAGRDLDPGRLADLNRLYGLT